MYIPNKQDYYLNPDLRSNYDLLLKSLYKDPSCIVFFDFNNIDKSIVNYVMNKDFNVDEKDLIMNPSLCNVSFVMRQAVKGNPCLIRYSGEKCYFDDNLLNDVFKQYTITVSDLKNNPSLCGNRYIMKFLPQYELYRSYLSDDERISAINDCIKNNIPLVNLPFLNVDFGSKVDSLLLDDLVDVFKINKSQSDIDFQEECYHNLDKLINSVISIRYNKASFKYSSIDSLNDSIYSSFVKSNSSNYSPITDIINDIYSFTDHFLSYEYIMKNIYDFYIIYMCTGSITLDTTSIFCNNVLNRKKDSFFSNQKKSIIKDIIPNFSLNEKKKKLLLTSKKINIVSNYIKFSQYSSLGVNEDQYNDIINSIVHDIVNNKYINKKGVNISYNDMEKIVNYFNTNGFLDYNYVSDLINCSNEKIISFICKKFENSKLEFVDNICLPSNLNYISYSALSKIGFNYNNFLIFDDLRYYDNLSKLVNYISSDSLEKVLDNRELIQPVKWLISYIDLFPELDVNTFINILSQYDVVSEKVLSYSDRDNLCDLINYSNIYASIDDIDVCALGQDIISVIGVDIAKEYLDFYIKMLYRKSTHIPSVSFSYDDHSFESGVFSDIERLLIGHKVKGYSCIKIGTDAFNEVLTGDNGDVILVRNELGELDSRIFVFRRGNVIQLVSNLNTKYSIKVYEEIAKQIVSKSVDDNIDYIFVNTSSCNDNKSYDVVEDSRFVTLFPHADLYNRAIKVFSKEGVDLDFDASIKNVYYKKRGSIINKPNPSIITRLRALDVIMETDSSIYEKKKCLFEPFYPQKYKDYYCGEDWYVAIGVDGSYEEVLLPIDEEISYSEILSLNDKLFPKTR